MSKKDDNKPLTGTALIKETCRRIRVARSYWDAHNNRRLPWRTGESAGAQQTAQRAGTRKEPQVLRVWLRYRSEKYFGEGRTQPGSDRK